jgi:hypothetical protein
MQTASADERPGTQGPQGLFGTSCLTLRGAQGRPEGRSPPRRAVVGHGEPRVETRGNLSLLLLISR